MQVKDKVLLVDAGNSSVKWAFSAEQAQLQMLKEYYPADTGNTFFKGLWGEEIKPLKVIVSSVANKRVWELIEKTCQDLWRIKPAKVISPVEGQGVINAYQHPADLGSDRWCAIVAAYHQAENATSVIVDCGTAITIDVVDPQGLHRGGYILPGLQMMQQNLGMQTANINLEQVKNVPATLAPSDSTTACVVSGSLLAAVSTIEAVVTAGQNNYGQVKTCITGGDANTISALLSVQHSVVPGLVLQGLALIAAGVEVN